MSGAPACHRVGLAPFVGMWTVMMAAMMFPAVIPVVIAFVTFARSRQGSPALFVGGYLLVWGLLGLPAYALLLAADQVTAVAPALAHAGAAILIACGLYQLTPLKDACLRHCRVPHLFLGHHWRDGRAGSLVLGAHHGLYCAGCCASLMIVLLVVGVMNLAWMVGLSALIFLEKALPGGIVVGRLAGIALCVAGIARLT